MNRNKYLIKNTIVFAIGNFATKMISFFLVPLYTNTMSASEYGVVDLLYTICNFLVPLFTFNIVESVLRFSLDKEKNENKIISIACTILLFTSIIGLITIPVINLFKDYQMYSTLFYFYLITLALSQILLTNLKGTEKLGLYSLGNFIYALLVAILNIYFLLHLNLGTKGYFLAYIIANIIVSIYSFITGNVIISLKKYDFDKKLFIKMIKYSTILIPTSFMWWIMNFVDRIMVTNYLSSAANGLYAVSYKIPTILQVASSIFTQAWLFSAIKEKEAQDNEKYTNNIFKFLTFGTVVVAAILLILIKTIFKFYVSNEYFISWKYVPFLMIGYVFLTLSTFVSTSYNVNKDSKGFLFSSMIGAGINIILNFILIPKIEIYGAALATAISYIGVFIYRIIDTKRYIKIKIDYLFILQIIFLIAISTLLYINNYISIVLQILIFIFYIICNRKIWIPILKIMIKKLRGK